MMGENIKIVWLHSKMWARKKNRKIEAFLKSYYFLSANFSMYIKIPVIQHE